jgi:HlyD family secretion protein
MTPKPTLLPKEIIAATADSLVRKYSVTSNIIYNTVIVAIILSIVILPLISIDISVHTSALIRPQSEISMIRSLVNGRVRESFVSENQPVQKGTVLYIIESNILDEKEKYLVNRKGEVNRFRNDLHLLIRYIASAETQFKTNLQTSYYQQSFSSHHQKWNELLTQYEKAKRDHERQQKLHDQKVIADAEFENFSFELRKAEHDLEILKQTQLSQWETELRNYEKEYTEYETQLIQLLKEKENLVIKAPVSGTVQNHAGIYSGSMVFANQDLAQISPDTSLMVEAYVSPNDIGLLKKAMPVRFQIDAFNYNQWGIITGNVAEVSNDIQFVNDKPVFKVKCTLAKDHLTLKNGYKGYLKKGMTLQARFIVTERTLWQLLYDKVDDWVNPNAYHSEI